MLLKRKSSVIDRRIKELHEEIGRLKNQFKSVSHSIHIPTEFREKPPESPAKEDVTSRGSSAKTQQQAHLPDVSQKASTRSREGNLPHAQSSHDSLTTGAISKSGSGRERFANYFMAGHFEDMHPLRQQTRIVRNKAILMLALVILAVFWLVYVLMHY